MHFQIATILFSTARMGRFNPGIGVTIAAWHGWMSAARAEEILQEVRKHQLLDALKGSSST